MRLGWARTTLPAKPPAMKANPMNKNSLARHTALESPNPSSPLILSLSMRFTTRNPRKEQMPGIQSTNDTCTGGSWSSPHGTRACADNIAASRNVQFASANYRSSRMRMRSRTRNETVAYQSACDVHPRRPSVFSQCEFGKRVQTDPSRVIVRSWKRHLSLLDGRER